MLNNLDKNNTEVRAKIAIIADDMGYTVDELLEDYEDELVDTRDTIDDFKKNCNEFGGNWKEKNGIRYLEGKLQLKKGTPRREFYLIPHEEWLITYIGG